MLDLNSATVIVSIHEIAPDGTLHEHKHPFAHYAHVLAGTLRVTNTSDVYGTGDFIIEGIGQWHRAVSLSDRPVKLLVIDQVAGDVSVIMRNQRG